MRIRILLLIIIAIVTMGASALSARTREGSDPFLLPQAGLWFGPASPVYETWGVVDPVLAGGAYLRYNIASLPLKFEVDASYQKHRSKGVNKAMIVPVYGCFLYKLPVRSIISFQLRGGMGGGYVRIWPDELSQWDPLFVLGGEFSFPAGTLANIGLRADYLCLYEKHIPGAKRNGNFVNVGITLNFNIDLFD